MLHYLCAEILANLNDRRECWETTRFAKAHFSDCGSFCFLRYNCADVLILTSVLLGKQGAKMRTPAVWGRGTSYNGRFYDVGWRHEPTMVNLYQAIDRPRRSGFRDSSNLWLLPRETIGVAITAFPTHLASATVHLLAGTNADDLVRVLFLPYEGPPEIKYLRVTLNQILAKMKEVARTVISNLKKDDFQGGNYQLSEESSSDLEADEIAMSADGDGSESHGID